MASEGIHASAETIAPAKIEMVYKNLSDAIGIEKA